MHANFLIHLHQLLIVRLLSQLFFESNYIILKYIIIDAMFEMLNCESIALTMLYDVNKKDFKVYKDRSKSTKMSPHSSL